MRACIILLVVLSGCASNRGLIIGNDDKADKVIRFAAIDAVDQIISQYPEKTQFNVKENDKFGESFAGVLRKTGFGTVDGKTVQGKKLDYLMDKLGDNLYRVSLFSDGKTMTRAYFNGVQVKTAGAWSVYYGK